MSDLSDVLPRFDTHPYSHLLHSLQKNEVTVADLISFDPTEIARKCPLPLHDVRKLANSVIEHLQKDMNIFTIPSGKDKIPSTTTNGYLSPNEGLDYISTGDVEADELLGGGIPAGYITEVVGESAVGKSQFLFGLLLSVQMPPPYGLGKSAIYLSTEDELNTRRLEQMLATHVRYQGLPEHLQPSFGRIHSMMTNTLEAQEQVLEFKLPLAVERYNVGLVVIDSVAANFRAEHETATSAGLGKRSDELAKMGDVLRRLAVDAHVAVLVANQVSDRFLDRPLLQLNDPPRSSSPASSAAPHNDSHDSDSHTMRADLLSLDHQQRFFTGWGDSSAIKVNEKTPALGLTWANQIDARIALKVAEDEIRRQATVVGRKRRRFMSLVFAPWTAASLKPLEYTIQPCGIVATVGAASQTGANGEPDDVLDESVWQDDEEFP